MFLLKFYKSLIVLIFILFLSLIPSVGVSKFTINIPHFDKIVHFFMYFSLSLVVLNDINKKIKKPTRQLILSVLFFIILLSGIIELVQESFIPGRFGSFFDLSANLLGVIVSVLIFFKTSIFSTQHQDF